MSGIAALVRIDQRPVDARDMQSMISQMRDRGPDGAQTWQRENVGLGHTLHRTTPEEQPGTQPIDDAERQLSITADLRIDNRDELISRLYIRDRDPDLLSDAEIVLRSYERWDTDCPKHLLGDFAFAIWDERRQRLFCARDHLGVKPLCYHHGTGHVLAVASTPKAITALESVPARLNEVRIADFLLDLEDADLTSTFFEDVFRLPPAHTLSWTAAGVKTTSYWTFEPEPVLRLRDDREYGAAFLDVFAKAVGARLRNHGRTGSMLSGGLDSGAIVAIGRTLVGEPLPTYSALSAKPDDCVESQAILAAQTMRGIEPHTISPSSWDHLIDDLHVWAQNVDEPFDLHMTLIAALNLEAARSGVTVLLDGVDADSLLADGDELRRQLRRLHFGGAWRNAKGLHGFWGGDSPMRLISKAAYRATVPRRLRVAIATTRRSRDPEILNGPSTILSDHLTELVAAGAGRREAGGTGPIPNHFNPSRPFRLSMAYLPVALERYDRVATAAGIEPRHPFTDLRVARFLSRLPGDQLLRDGSLKSIVRRSLDGGLPDGSRLRAGKEHLGWTYTQARHDAAGSPAPIDLIGQHAELLRRFVALDRLRVADEAGRIDLVAELAAWLQ